MAAGAARCSRARPHAYFSQGKARFSPRRSQPTRGARRSSASRCGGESRRGAGQRQARPGGKPQCTGQVKLHAAFRDKRRPVAGLKKVAHHENGSTTPRCTAEKGLDAHQIRVAPRIAGNNQSCRRDGDMIGELTSHTV